MITGATATYLKMHNDALEQGEFMTKATHGAANVACAGRAHSGNTLPDRDAVGKTIKVNGKRFKVIGVLKRRRRHCSARPTTASSCRSRRFSARYRPTATRAQASGDRGGRRAGAR